MEKTKTILHSHRDALDRIAALLFKRGKFTGGVVGEENEMDGVKAL